MEINNLEFTRLVFNETEFFYKKIMSESNCYVDEQDGFYVEYLVKRWENFEKLLKMYVLLVDAKVAKYSLEETYSVLKARIEETEAKLEDNK